MELKYIKIVLMNSTSLNALSNFAPLHFIGSREGYDVSHYLVSSVIWTFPLSLCYSVTKFKLGNNIRSVEVTGLPVAVSFHSLVICRQYNWTERQTVTSEKLCIKACWRGKNKSVCSTCIYYGKIHMCPKAVLFSVNIMIAAVSL